MMTFVSLKLKLCNPTDTYVYIRHVCFCCMVAALIMYQGWGSMWKFPPWFTVRQGQAFIRMQKLLGQLDCLLFANTRTLGTKQLTECLEISLSCSLLVLCSHRIILWLVRIDFGPLGASWSLGDPRKVHGRPKESSGRPTESPGRPRESLLSIGPPSFPSVSEKLYRDSDKVCSL